MAILPQEFPVVLTVFLALGAWRISKQRVLTRRIPAIETLGAATVLCVDKTGTLTYGEPVLSEVLREGIDLFRGCKFKRAGERLVASFSPAGPEAFRAFLRRPGRACVSHETLPSEPC
jgi:hypothetical protein